MTGYWRNKLADVISERDLANLKAPSMIMSRDRFDDRTGKIYKEFLLVKDYVEFYERIKTETVGKHFYEIIYGNQKPHFDIDLKIEGDEIPHYWKDHIDKNREEFISEFFLSTICQAIYDSFSKLYSTTINPEKNFIIMDSSTHEKISFHIVIDGVFHKNCQDAKKLYDLTYMKIKEKIYDFPDNVLDHAVYKRNQPFRVLGSTKIKKENRKCIYRGPPVHIFVENKKIELGTNAYKEDFEGERVIAELEIFARTLVSNTVICQGLRSRVIRETESGTMSADRVNPNPSEKYCMTDDLQKKIWELFIKTKYYRNIDNNPCFRIRNVNENRINLNRLCPYHCPVCDREHENENPYIEKEIMTNRVFYCCRRKNPCDDKNKLRKILLGILE